MKPNLKHASVPHFRKNTRRYQTAAPSKALNSVVETIVLNLTANDVGACRYSGAIPFDMHKSHHSLSNPRARVGVFRPLEIGRPILMFGLLGGALIVLLKHFEYRYLIRAYSGEVYRGLIAVVFVSFGIWLGLTLTKKTETIVIKEVMAQPSTAFVRNTANLGAVGITPRELQILELIASGLSNKEIAETIFVSENTVKTH
ncbi:MAG: LuxR C-terminal-related transcriptional regulator, partial [Gemmatimonadaceae bacterium]